MNTIRTFINSFKSLATTPVALAILAALYAILLATTYYFIRVREATVWQVALTLFLLVLIPLEFFVIQSAIIQLARTGKFSWAALIRDAIKLAVITVPFILLGFGINYLLNKWQLRHLAPEPVMTISGPAAQPQHWPTVLFATVRYFVLGVVLPLATIHLWIEITGRDLRAVFSGPGLRGIANAFARALAFDSVLTYVLGAIFFFLIPYAILFVPYQFKGNKTDFAVFVLRLLLVYALTLIGWTVTITALTKSAGEVSPRIPASAVANHPVEAAA
jgi:hypothetical protein